MASPEQSYTPEQRQCAREFVWHTQSEGKMTIGQMADSHLANLEAWLMRRIEAAREEHDRRMVMICDDKILTSFSGVEDAVYRWKEVASHVRIERQARREEKITQEG